MRQAQLRGRMLAGVSLAVLLLVCPGQARSQPVAPQGATPANGTAGATGAVIPSNTGGSAVDNGKGKTQKGGAETIVVTGIRGSLNKSIRIKRDSAVVLDSINATELGRFPDSDVADSLQHITGITINRTTGGEGQYVSVRGLGSAYNITTLNGRLLATDDDGRDFAFDILPADVISGADVLKSPQASALEGSIGGTVNLRSARAFDNPGFHAVMRAEGSYNDMSEDGGYKVSGFVSDTNASNTLGNLFGVVYSDQKIRTDSLNYATYDPNNPGVWPPPPTQGAPAPPGAKPVVALCCISLGSVVDQKERYAITDSLEWRPSDTLRITLDGTYTKLNDPQVAYNQAYYPDFSYDQNGNPEWSNVTVRNGYITKFTASNFVPEAINQTIDRRVSTYVVGLNASWEPIDRLTVSADVYRSEANRPEGGTDNFVTAGLVSPTPYNQDTLVYSANPNSLPNIAVILPNGKDYAKSLASGALNNQALWSTHYVGLSGYSISDVINAGKLDASYAFYDSILRHIDVGVSYSDRTKSRDDISNDWDNGSNQYSSLYNTLPGQPGPISFASLGEKVISTFTFPNYLSGAGGIFPTTQVLINEQALLAGLKHLNGTPNYTSGSGVYEFANTLPRFNAINSYAVREKTTSGYAQASFGGERWSANAGVRIVHTDTLASTAVNNIVSVTVADTANPTNAGVVDYSPITPVNAKGTYTVPLPSANFLYHLTDRLQLRLAGARVIARPDLNQLAPTATNNAINQQYQLIYAGNASLQPIKAWQEDISLEWYYQPSALVSVAFFNKDLTNDITTEQLNNVNIGAVGCFNGAACVPLPFSIIKPINGNTDSVYGIELSWQHILPMGLGLRSQFTESWSHTVINGQNAGPVAGVAPTTFSLNPFYEKGPLSLSVSWDYTSPFWYQTFTEVTGEPAKAKHYDWVTASAAYNFTKRLRFYLEGKNLTNSIVRTYLNGNPYAVWANGNTGTSSAVGQGFTAYGRTITFGMRYGF
jgi:TonB-dependent receptor